ncbi:MAG: ABC transporter permease [Nitrospirae bacterium]|nr:ABC transporter permease [Nitrospirota bacterium]
MKGWFAGSGRGILSGVEHTGRVAIFFGQTLQFGLTARWKWKNIIEQMVNIGVGSLPVIMITGAFMGMVLALQSYYQLHKLAVETGIGALVGLSMARELGPVMTGIMLTARVGAAMAAELGTMKVTEQIDALQALATNPIQYLVVPRFLSCLILAPLLTVYTVFIGVTGGYLIGVKMMGINSAFYLSHTVSLVGPADIMTGLIKAVFFGMIIAIVSCYKGLTTTGGAEGVGKATTGAVVTSSILILIADFFLTIIFKIINM